MGAANLPDFDNESIQTIVRDVVLIGIIFPMGLAAIHFLVPQSIQNTLEMSYADPTPVILWTSAYVHAGNSHLFDNVVGYIVFCGMAYYLSVIKANRRRWFFRTFLTFLVVLPALVSLASLWFFSTQVVATIPPGRGFSGVAAGFLGFTTVALLVWLRQTYDREVVMSVLLAVITATGVAIMWRYGKLGSPTAVVVLGGGAIVSVGAVGYRGLELLQREYEERLKHLDRALVTGGTILVIAYGMGGLFPAELISDGSLTNVIGHGAGVVFGGVLARISRPSLPEELTGYLDSFR